MLPNACFIVFTGTPLMKSQKKFYSQNLVELLILIPSMKPLLTKAIVPILYEGRFAVQDVNQNALDRGFDIVAEDLT